jgi:hypothetical protein
MSSIIYTPADILSKNLNSENYNFINLEVNKLEIILWVLIKSYLFGLRLIIITFSLFLMRRYTIVKLISGYYTLNLSIWN